MDIKKIISHAKEYGFIFPSSDIYEGLSAVYDYAHNGVELKNNIKNYWWKAMVDLHSNIVGIDSAIFMHPTTWKASGHVDAFNDPLIDNKDSKLRYRADSLVEEYCEKLDNKILKEISKAKKRFGKDFDEKKFIQTNPKVSELKNILSQWQFGENKSLPISEVLKDPDLFGGEEDRIPWVEKAFKNSETNLTPKNEGNFKWVLLFGIVIILFIFARIYNRDKNP